MFNSFGRGSICALGVNGGDAAEQVCPDADSVPDGNHAADEGASAELVQTDAAEYMQDTAQVAEAEYSKPVLQHI